MKKCKQCNGYGKFQEGGTLSRFVRCDCKKLPKKKNDRPALTFAHFHAVNVARSKSDIKHSNNWIPLSWGGALAGEVGELCNFLKKMSRGDKIKKKELAHEIADIMTYLSLLSDQLDIDMEKAIIEKFNIVSKRWGSKFKL